MYSGIYTIKNLNGKILNSAEKNYQDPYLVFRTNHSQYFTSISIKNGENPVWRDTLIIKIAEEKYLDVECWDYNAEKDDKIGVCSIDVRHVYEQKKVAQIVQLISNGVKVGQLNLDIEYSKECSGSLVSSINSENASKGISNNKDSLFSTQERSSNSNYIVSEPDIRQVDARPISHDIDLLQLKLKEQQQAQIQQQQQNQLLQQQQQQLIQLQQQQQQQAQLEIIQEVPTATLHQQQQQVIYQNQPQRTQQITQVAQPQKIPVAIQQQYQLQQPQIRQPVPQQQQQHQQFQIAQQPQHPQAIVAQQKNIKKIQQIPTKPNIQNIQIIPQQQPQVTLKNNVHPYMPQQIRSPQTYIKPY